MQLTTYMKSISTMGFINTKKLHFYNRFLDKPLIYNAMNTIRILWQTQDRFCNSSLKTGQLLSLYYLRGSSSLQLKKPGFLTNSECWYLKHWFIHESSNLGHWDGNYPRECSSMTWVTLFLLAGGRNRWVNV